MHRTIRRRGATLPSYGILVGLIAIVAVVATQNLGLTIRELFGNLAWTVETSEAKTQEDLGWVEEFDRVNPTKNPDNGWAIEMSDRGRWRVSEWDNGSVFANAWDEAQITSDGDIATITLERATRDWQAAGDTTDLFSGEIRTFASYAEGHFTARMQVSDVPGTVSAFFLFADPGSNEEIDIEILGDDPTKVQLNYWHDGVQNPVTKDLGFDASEGFHTYGFKFSDQGINFTVDGDTIHSVPAGAGLPDQPMQLMVNHWAVDASAGSWSSAYDTTTNPVSKLYVDDIVYRKQGD